MIIVSYYACDFSDMGRQNNTQFSSISFIKMPFFFLSATHQHSKRVKTNGQVTALVHDLLMEKKNIV